MSCRHYSYGFGATAPTVAVAPPPPSESFWQRHSAEIIVGTITAVTGALAVYFAMRVVERRRR